MAVHLDVRYAEALSWMTTLHAGQTRRIHGEPYISHLLRVGGMVLEYAETQEEAIAALLHDAAEDQGGRAVLDEIAERFGSRTASLVEQCSDSLEARNVPKASWRVRKEQHLAHVALAEPAAKRILICDKIDNARSILHSWRQEGDAIFHHFHGGREILWYFQSMLPVLRNETPPEWVWELEQILHQLID
ncbi:MAG: HD domain-containing protein [Planctomycetia bacterium]|nr:HD domain-containing protein [Planctomycetia bacterium]